MAQGKTQTEASSGACVVCWASGAGATSLGEMKGTFERWESREVPSRPDFLLRSQTLGRRAPCLPPPHAGSKDAPFKGLGQLFTFLHTCIEQPTVHLLIATFHAKAAQRGTGIWQAHMPGCPLGHFGILEVVRLCTRIRRNTPK